VAEVLFTRGWDVLAVWRWVGLSYGAAICLAAVVLRVPPGLAVVRARPNPSLRALLRNRFVWALLVGMFCGTFAGLLVIGNLKSMALSNGLMPTMAAVAISAFAVGNASGRVTWGWVADRMGLGVVLLTLSFLAAALLLLVPTSASPATFLVASVLTGFGFGACFVVYVTLIGSRYGPQRVASVYPLVFLAYGISGVAGPWAGGLLYDATASHTPGIALSVAVVAVGLALNVWLLRGLWPVGASAFVAASVPLESGGNEDEQGCRLNRHGQQVGPGGHL
jgi:OFA family oxalate/formate antiporter-like MFS transporter